MTGRLRPGVRPLKGGKLAASMTLAAMLAALFMVIGGVHAAAHGDEPHADCVAGHVSYAAASKLAPSDDATISAPPLRSFRIAAPTYASGPEVALTFPTRSRGPPLHSDRSV